MTDPRAGTVAEASDLVDVAHLVTAYYTGDTFKPAARVPLDQVLHIDGW